MNTSTVLLEQSVHSIHDGTLSGICINVDAGMIMITRHDSDSCKYYICNVLHEGPDSIGNTSETPEQKPFD